MSTGSLCTKMHIFGDTDTSIDGTSGRQAVQLLGNALTATANLEDADLVKTRIMSLKVSNNQTTAMTVDFIDGAGLSAFSGKLIHRVHVGALKENLDFDMHGAIVSNGLYVLVTGTGTKVNLSVSAQYN